MTNILKTILIIIAITTNMGCDKNEVEPEADYRIEFGSECGWCAGQEFISINSSEINYIRNIPCGEEKGTIKKGRLLTSDEWNKITSSFDYSLFKTLDYSECNVCADGCDEIIKITENNKTHELRYSLNDDVEGMQDLRMILNDLLEKMRDTN